MSTTELMVSRFLAWELPKDFAPDGGITFVAPSSPMDWPTGTNLLTALQARAMIEHVTACYSKDLDADYIKRESMKAPYWIREPNGGAFFDIVSFVHAMRLQPSTDCSPQDWKTRAFAALGDWRDGMAKPDVDAVLRFLRSVR